MRLLTALDDVVVSGQWLADIVMALIMQSALL